ncbi:MAG TPA: hypothetical protein VFI76_08925 [Terrimicrobiaceae bacterium]|nr:hypothetical protein [Terrimicrobiaceae bacterium]
MPLYINQMQDVLIPYIDANVPVQVASSPGAGKSESIDQIITYLSERDGFEWGCSKVFIAGLSPVDMYGFMTPGVRRYHDWEGKEHEAKVSEFAMPPYMISIDGRPMNSFKRGITVFEEWDKGDPDTKKASAEPILKGGFGQNRMHAGISRIVLVNRAEDRSGTTKNFDFIINRRSELEFHATMLGWQEWAQLAGIHPIFTSFADRWAQLVFTNEVPEKQGPFATPRSLVLLEKVMKQRVVNGNIVVDDITAHNANGLLGTTVGAQLISWLRVKTETPDWDDIVANPEGIEVPERADACLMSVYECAHRVDMKTIRPAIRYMRRLPKEFAMSFAQASIKRLPKLVADKSMMDWSKENRSLLNVLGGARQAA